MKSPKVLAFYLPQFHPTAENDGWWTPGFTEWTNVVRGRPLFDGHRQPHLPGELGFYDLRLPETRVAQAALAAEHGIDGFCYYHYWFGGRRMLDRTFEEVRETGSPDFPFCLLWANETWARTWYVGSNELLLPQVYSEEDDIAHVEYLVDAFADERYVRVDGRPLFIVYRIHDHPDPAGFGARLRRRSAEAGVGDPYLVHVDVFDNEIVGPQTVGFDASMAFLPHGIGRITPDLEVHTAADGRTYKSIDYAVVANAYLNRPDPGWRHHPCVVPEWDNTARRLDAGAAHLLTDPSVELYQQWLAGSLRKEVARGEYGLLFINAWNEWAEGAHLEPDLDHGRAYLEATRAAIEEVRGPVERIDVGDPSETTPVERIAHHLHTRLASMLAAETDAFLSFERELRRRTAELQAERDDARAGERRLFNLLDAVLATDRPKRMGIGAAVTAYIDLVALQTRELDDAPAAASMTAIIQAAEASLGADVAGDVATIGKGSVGVAVVLRAALQAYDRTGRYSFATDLGAGRVPAHTLMARLGIDDHWSELFAESAAAIGLADRTEALALLRVGAIDDATTSGELERVVQRVSRGGIVVIDGAGPDATAAVTAAAQSTGVKVVVASPADENADQSSA